MKEEEAAPHTAVRISHPFSFENRQAGCARSLCEEIDPESGYPFYFNRFTGASSWDRPKVLGLRDDEDGQSNSKHP